LGKGAPPPQGAINRPLHNAASLRSPPRRDSPAVSNSKESHIMTMMMSRKALEEYGLVNLGKIYWNLSPAVLVEQALAGNEGMLASNGAFAATTGVHTGRSPKDKYVVSNEESATKIWWGEINYPMSPGVFEVVRN